MATRAFCDTRYENWYTGLLVSPTMVRRLGKGVSGASVEKVTAQ